MEKYLSETNFWIYTLSNWIFQDLWICSSCMFVVVFQQVRIIQQAVAEAKPEHFEN